MVVLESRPDTAGAKVEKVYANSGIPARVVLDSAVGYVMERAHLVVVGSKGVVDNRIIVNKMEMYAMGIAARELGKPFYVTANSYNFAKAVPAEPVRHDRDGTGGRAEICGQGDLGGHVGGEGCGDAPITT